MPRRAKDELEQAIEDALAPGVSIGYHASSDFVDEVDAVRARLIPLIKGEAARAVVLLETLI